MSKGSGEIGEARFAAFVKGLPDQDLTPEQAFIIVIISIIISSIIIISSSSIVVVIVIAICCIDVVVIICCLSCICVFIGVSGLRGDADGRPREQGGLREGPAALLQVRLHTYYM